MPILPYYSDEFTVLPGAPSLPNLLTTGNHSLPCSWSQIAWAAITVGRNQWKDVVQFQQYSRFEIIYRLAMVFANLRTTRSSARRGRLYSTNAFRRLDPSEKSAISYFLGLMIGKLFSESLLETPWVMHLDVYRNQLMPILVGRSKPDLVGMNTSGDWLVLESKGRSNSPPNSLIQDAKDQTGQLTQIAGVTPALAVATVGYFDSKGTLRAKIRDPKVPKRRGRRLGCTPIQLLRDYYDPFLHLLSNSKNERGEDAQYLMLRIDEADLSVGMDREIFKYLQSIDTDKGAVDFILSDAKRHFIEGEKKFPLVDTNPVFIGRDGIRVELGNFWTQMNMQPEERTH